MNPPNFYRMEYMVHYLAGKIPMGRLGKKGVWSQSKRNSGNIPMPFKQWRNMFKTMTRKEKE